MAIDEPAPTASSIAVEDAELRARLLAEDAQARRQAEAERRPHRDFAVVRQHMLEDGPLNRNRYDTYLDAMGEPPLRRTQYMAGSEMYRFLWLRSFGVPISVRATWASGKGALTYVVLGPPSDTATVGRIAKRKVRTLTGPEWNKITECFDPVLPTMEPEVRSRLGTGMDGATWLVDGFRHNAWVLVERWSPDASDVEVRDFRRCCLLMLGLAGIEPREDD